MKISIVIPLFNEEKRFRVFFPKLYNFAQRAFKPGQFEFICVNDGSKDKTKTIVNKFKKTYPEIQLFNLKHNKGKGCALRYGVKQAQAELIFFTDIDLSADIAMILNLVEHIEKDAEIAIASRRLPKSNIALHQNFMRESLGKAYTQISKKLLGLPYVDITCGLKGGKNKAMKKIFSRMQIDRWSFDSELLFIARKHGMKVTEQPVTWINNNQSKVNLLLDSYRSLKEILQIRLNDVRGKYD